MKKLNIYSEFIQSSHEKLKTTQSHDLDNDFVKAQETSMSKTWDNDKDKALDEL